ncbi:glucose-1-phosphate thymidylyltransferase [Halobacteriales archaeon QS_5_70_15]|nr:MAG: glucose-1-phosphate thymidylyltransferase [Halobacteriales archaeon QS_5_70_15]
MQAVVLAAGRGTRMRPLTETVPKPMLPVADRPLAAHTADAAVDAGATELVFVVGYEADAVRAHFGDSYRGVPVAYAVQDEQLGTAHAVRTAREHLEGPFAVLNGDNLYDPEGIAALFDAAPAVAGYRVPDPTNYGVLSTDGRRVAGVVEKPEDPPSDLANAGAYAFPAEARGWLDVERSERGEHEITDVLARVADASETTAVELDRWMDVGRPWELLEANEWKLAELDRRIGGEIHDDAALHGSVVVEEGAVIESGVVVEGPALVRSGADVGPNAYVRGATLLAEDVHVGHGVEVKNTVVMSGTAVPHLSVVAGPGAKTGINTSLDPGVVLSAGATTLPGERIDRDR